MQFWSKWKQRNQHQENAGNPSIYTLFVPTAILHNACIPCVNNLDEVSSNKCRYFFIGKVAWPCHGKAETLEVGPKDVVD